MDDEKRIEALLEDVNRGFREGTATPDQIRKFMEFCEQEPKTTLQAEFEELRRQGPKWSKMQRGRMNHLEMHLDRGDVVCECYP